MNVNNSNDVTDSSTSNSSGDHHVEEQTNHVEDQRSTKAITTPTTEEKELSNVLIGLIAHNNLKVCTKHIVLCLSFAEIFLKMSSNTTDFLFFSVSLCLHSLHATPSLQWFSLSKKTLISSKKYVWSLLNQLVVLYQALVCPLTFIRQFQVVLWVSHHDFLLSDIRSGLLSLLSCLLVWFIRQESCRRRTNQCNFLCYSNCFRPRPSSPGVFNFVNLGMTHSSATTNYY